MKLKISGACGILAPIIAFFFIFLAISSAPEFSWTNNALSDLGVIPGVTSALFNYNLIVIGFLGFTFSISLLRLTRFESLSRDTQQSFPPIGGSGGALLFSLACLALIAIGVFPENVAYLHFYASVAFFVLLISAMLSMSVGFWRARKKRIALFTLLLSVVAAVPWLLLFVIRYVSGVAIPEIISAVAGGLCAEVLGFKMLKIASHAKVT